MPKHAGITLLIGGAVAALLVLAGVDALRSAGSKPSAPTASVPATNAPKTTTEPTSTPTLQDIMELVPFTPLEPGTYVIDPDVDPSTPSAWCTRSPRGLVDRGSARSSSSD